MPVWLSRLFSYQGRIGRAQYLYINLGIGIGWIILNIMMIGVSQTPNPDIGFGTAITLVALWCLSVVLQAAAIVKRFHDLDRPGTHYWLTLVPFYNLYLGFVLHFSSGVGGSNRFGPSPGVGAESATRERGSLPVTAGGPRPRCDEWTCSRCGMQNETTCCSRCGAESFKPFERRSA